MSAGCIDGASVTQFARPRALAGRLSQFFALAIGVDAGLIYSPFGEMGPGNSQGRYWLQISIQG